MLWLQMCLGAKLKSGPVSMWRISPICKGIGIALVLVQAIVAIYSAISIGWILVFFRDSFMQRSNHYYRWQHTFESYRNSNNVTINTASQRLTESAAAYFNTVVLQRFQVVSEERGASLGAVRFQAAFNLAIVWFWVFMILCKGLRSYGKIVLGLIVLPLLGLGVLCTKLLVVAYNSGNMQVIFLPLYTNQ